MSVVKNRRSLSRLEFYSNARRLRADVTGLLLRDFGVRDRIRAGEDGRTVTESFPGWLTGYFRGSMIRILANMMHNIVAANSVYPITVTEAEYRRGLQDKAIANCEQLLEELMYCAEVLPVPVSALEPYAEAADREIALLKGWRKSNNGICARIKNRAGREEK